MRVKVFAYYTANYADDALKLKCSLDELAVPYKLQPIMLMPPIGGPPTGDAWKRAVMMKAEMILKALCALETEYDGLFYTDADSILRRPPPWDAAFSGCDVGYAQFRWSKGHAIESLTGGLYLARSPHVASFVSAWNANTPKWAATDTPEQHSLAETLKQWDYKIVSRVVSTEWVSIFDAPHEQGHRPIFTHMQASRLKRHL